MCYFTCCYFCSWFPMFVLSSVCLFVLCSVTQYYKLLQMSSRVRYNLRYIPGSSTRQRKSGGVKFSYAFLYFGYNNHCTIHHTYIYCYIFLFFLYTFSTFFRRLLAFEYITQFFKLRLLLDMFKQLVRRRLM
jgi:hypothetical protein